MHKPDTPMFEWDQEANSGYVAYYGDVEVVRTEQVSEACNIDYDKDGRVVGIELFGPKWLKGCECGKQVKGESKEQGQ